MRFFATKLATAGAVFILCTACAPKKATAPPENRITFNDFESFDGWVDAPVTDEKAHSGRYSLKVAPGAEYGMSYTTLLSKAGITKANKITVDAWAMRASSDSKSVVVVEVTDPANPTQKVFWESLDLHQEIKTFNTWTRVRKEFKLPDTVQPSYRLRVYLWLAGASQPTFLDDVEITKS